MPVRCDAALAALPERFRGIDLLVNNAGLALGTGPRSEADLDEWRTMIDTNVTALVTSPPAAADPDRAARARSSTSVRSRRHYPYPGGNVYGGTKAFVRQFSLGLRSDLHGTGVRVTSIEPGMAETEFTLVRTGGDQAASDKTIPGRQADDRRGHRRHDVLGRDLPPHLNINRLEIMPVSQSFAGFQIDREPG